jgi:hypothetical protein
MYDRMRSAYRFLVRKPEMTRPLGRSRQSCEDTIKMHHKEVEYESVD